MEEESDEAIRKAGRLVEMRVREVDISCEEETRWNGSKTRSIRGGVKLFSHEGGETRKCNLEGITNLTMSSNIVQVMEMAALHT